MAAQSTDVGISPTSRGRETETHGARTPPTAGWLSVCPPVRIAGACRLGPCSLQESWPCQAKLAAGPLKGKGLGQPGGGPSAREAGLCPSLGPREPSQEERVGPRQVTASGAQARSAPAHRNWDRQHAGPAAPRPVAPRRLVSRCGRSAEDEGWAAEAWLSSPGIRARPGPPLQGQAGRSGAGARGSHGLPGDEGQGRSSHRDPRMWSRPRPGLPSLAPSMCRESGGLAEGPRGRRPQAGGAEGLPVKLTRGGLQLRVVPAWDKQTHTHGEHGDAAEHGQRRQWTEDTDRLGPGQPCLSLDSPTPKWGAGAEGRHLSEQPPSLPRLLSTDQERREARWTRPGCIHVLAP